MAPHRPSNTQHPSQVLAALDVACATTARLIQPTPVAMPTPTPTVDTMETSPELGGAELAGAEPVAVIRCREDDELTSLSWLQDRNLLKSIRVGTGGGPEDALSDSSPGGSSADDYLDESSDGGADVRGAANGGGNIGAVHVPYNPKLHVTAKPPYSFSCLIFMAIEECSAKALPVKDIYAWILTHFPYFQNAPTGWKNSVRHNLSLNKCFRKVDKDKGQNIGKGSLWCIDPDYRPNLLQALRKTPYHPYHQLQMLANATPQHTQLAPKPLPLAPRLNGNIPNPELFPYLSKRLAASSIKDPEVDAAATMLALKDGTHILQDYDTDFYSRNGNAQGDKRNKRFRNRFRNSTPGYLHKLHENSVNRVITTNPTEDHTYSTCPNADRSASPSSIDEAFEFSEPSDATDDEQVDDVSNMSSYDDFDTDDDQDEDEDWENVPNRGNRLISSSFRSDDDEERKKIVEGADALLNLAGIRTNLANPRRANHTTHHRAIVNADVAQR